MLLIVCLLIVFCSLQLLFLLLPLSPLVDDIFSSSMLDRPVGLVVTASASRAEDPGFESRLRRDFPGVESHQ